MAKKGLTQANTLRSNNTTSTGYGIVYADEIIGSRSVKTKEDLNKLPDWVLGKDNKLEKGTTYYVENEKCFYIYTGDGWQKSFKSIGLPVKSWYAYNNDVTGTAATSQILDISKIIKGDDLYVGTLDGIEEQPHPFATIVVYNDEVNKVPIAYITLFESSDPDNPENNTVVASAKVFGVITKNVFPKTPDFNNINYYEGNCRPLDTGTQITNWKLIGGNSITNKVWELNDFSIKGNTIKTSEIDFTTDTLQKFNDSISSGDHVIKTQYSVVDTTHNNIVGQMFLIGDSLGHMVTEILTTSAILKNGVINWNEHSDTIVNTYIRRNHVKEGGNSNIAVGSWSTWTYYSGEGQFNDFKKLVAGELNKKVNTSDIVQQTGDSTTSVMSQKAVSNKLATKADTEQVNNSLYNLEKKIGDRVVVNGNVTNLPDEEDLTSVEKSEHNVLRLADRSYAPENFSGKGYKILRKNIQSVSIAVTKIRVESVPSSDGTLSFTINGKDTQVSVSASADNTTSLVAQKIASEVQKSMTEYKVSTNDSLVTITKIKPGSVTPSTFSSNNTGVICTVSDDTKTELRNILTQNMVDYPNTIYEVRYDFTTIKDVHLSNDSVFYINGGSVDSNYVYYQTDEILSIDENSGVFNSAVVNADKATINVNSIVNPKTSKVAINNATVNFNNGYIDRKDENGNDLDFNLGLYNGIFPIGRYRMFGNWRSERLSYFRTIYTSEFIGLVKNNSLADIYEICIYKTLHENFKYDLIIDSPVIIDRTINLIKEINIIGNGGSALVKITINNPTVNVFEVNPTFEFTLYNKTIKYRIYGNYNNGVKVKGLVLYSESNYKCNNIVKLNTSTQLLLKDIKVGTHFNRFFNKILVCNIEGTKDADYTDFLILDNVSKDTINTAEDFDVNYADVVLGGGDCSTIINCSKTSFLIYGGQKYISNCMQSPIFACNCDLNLVNIHNEECNYYIDNSSVYFDSCLFMNAFNVTDSCMHINSGKVQEWVDKHVGHHLYVTTKPHFLTLSFKHCQFMKTTTSPLPLKVTNYDIKFYDKEDVHNISLDDTISADRFGAGENSTNISTNVKDLKGSKNTNASILDKMKVVEWNIYESNKWNPTIKRDEEYFKIPKSYDIKVNYIILLIDPKRQLGYKHAINITHNITEDAETCLCLKLGKEYNDTSIILDCTIDGTHVQGYAHIYEITKDFIILPILKTSILHSTPSIYLENVISPVNVISQNDNNVEVTLNELPKLGIWNINDIVNIGALKYKYDGFKWNLINCSKGDSSSRPILSLSDEGFEYYDSTLKKKILWTGNAWVNLDGTELS